VAGLLDYETVSQYDLTILAQDNAAPQTATAIIARVLIGNTLEDNAEVVRLALTQPGGPFAGHANPALIGFGADPDGDGSVNAVEVLFGTDPAGSDAPPAVSVAPMQFSGQTWMAYELDVNASAANLLRFQLDGTANLANWFLLTNPPANIFEGGGRRHYRVRDNVPLQDVQFRALRLGLSPSDPPP
jgi:hypothetical protein